jgi:hypothetical protein
VGLDQSRRWREAAHDLLIQLRIAMGSRDTQNLGVDVSVERASQEVRSEPYLGFASLIFRSCVDIKVSLLVSPNGVFLALVPVVPALLAADAAAFALL